MIKHFITFSVFILVILIGCTTIEPTNKPTNEPTIAVNKISLDSSLYHIFDDDTINLNIKFNPPKSKIPRYTIRTSEAKVLKIENNKVIAIDQGTAQVIISIDSMSSISDTCTFIVKRRIGTVDNPILIYTAEDLKKYKTLINQANSKYNDRYYKLMNDIDLSSDPDWFPIGYWDGNADSNRPFSGVFDGNNKMIKNITITNINSKREYSTGLFGYIGDGTIKNLGVSYNSINCSTYDVGGIAGVIYEGNIINCFTEGNIVNNSGFYNAYTGGIAGFIDWSTNIYNCYSNANVYSYHYSGGLVGASGNNSFIINSYSSGTISFTSYSNSFNLGGIAGYSAGTINNCLALNDSIIGYGSCGYGKITAGCNFYNNNYSSQKTKVIISKQNITDFSDKMKNGEVLSGNPVDLLNNYIDSNNSLKGVLLKKWKTDMSMNNGLPIFE